MNVVTDADDYVHQRLRNKFGILPGEASVEPRSRCHGGLDRLSRSFALPATVLKMGKLFLSRSFGTTKVGSVIPLNRFAEN